MWRSSPPATTPSATATPARCRRPPELSPAANAAVWGLTTLTTAAIINEAVDDAVNDHVTYIAVPNSDYRLLYGTVEPVGSQSVSFEVELGDSDIEMEADCNRGTLDGRDPRTAAEAELLNAACQVAFGSV